MLARSQRPNGEGPAVAREALSCPTDLRECPRCEARRRARIRAPSLPSLRGSRDPLRYSRSPVSLPANVVQFFCSSVRLLLVLVFEKTIARAESIGVPRAYARAAVRNVPRGEPSSRAGVGYSCESACGSRKEPSPTRARRGCAARVCSHSRRAHGSAGCQGGEGSTRARGDNSSRVRRRLAADSTRLRRLAFHP